MNKKIESILIAFVLFVFSLYVFTNSQTIIESIRFSVSLWMNQLIPSLFPFFFLSELMIQYGIVEFLGELFRPFMNKIFHLGGECAFVLAMSMISGFPSGAKYTRSLLDEGKITTKEANHLITFTHFSNPLFILGTVGTILLQNQSLAILILFCHYITNFIIGFLFRSKQLIPSHKTDFRTAIIKMHNYRVSNHQSFGTVLKNATFHTFQTLLLMLGVITFFLMITSLFRTWIPLSSTKTALFSGILEMTQGIYAVSQLMIPTTWIALLITFFLSFGGLSVHMQVYSIIGDSKIKYAPFFVARLLHGGISCLLLYGCLSLFRLL